jgi:hypothetical protein
VDNDQYEQTAATMEMAALHVQRDRYQAMAEQHAQSLRAHQPSNRWGLSEEQREIAEAAIVDRPDMPKLSNDQKHEIYYHQRNRHHAMVSNGSYGGSPAGRSK